MIISAAAPLVSYLLSNLLWFGLMEHDWDVMLCVTDTFTERVEICLHLIKLS